MRKFLVIVFIFLFAFPALSQKQVPKNLPKYDRRRLRFGYTIGYTTMDFVMHHSGTFLSPETDTVFGFENKRLPGFHLSIVSEFHLVEYLDLRFLPGLSFGERNLSYLLYDPDDNDFNVHIMQIESTFLDFPLLLKYSSKRLNNYRAYIIGGGSIRYDLAAQKDIRPEEKPKIRLNPMDYYYEVGFGVDFFLEYFKFSTEIKMARGITNIMVPDNTQFTSSIERMNSKLICVSMHFEGGKYEAMSSLMGKILWWRN